MGSTQNMAGAFVVLCSELVAALGEQRADALMEEFAGAVTSQQGSLALCCSGQQGISPEGHRGHASLMFGCLLFSGTPRLVREHPSTTDLCRSPQKKEATAPAAGVHIQDEAIEVAEGDVTI